MNWPGKIRTSFRGLCRKRELDAEMDEEMRSHIEMRTEQNIAAGMSQEEARYAALKQFGWMDSIKQTCREERRFAWLDNLIQDVRYGARMLRKDVSFTAVAVMTLALGIGANTAIFSLVNAVLLRPLPFREPNRLVWITNPELSGAGVPGMTRSVNLHDWREMTRSFEDLGCYIAWYGRQQTILIVDGEKTRVEGAFVDRHFLKVLGISPRLGRDFLAEDGYQSMILTDNFWKRQFQADRTIVGKAITISGRSWTVVGVLPPAFDFTSIFMPGSRVDFLRPSLTFGDLSDNSHAVIGRLKPGVNLRQAQLEFDTINQQLREAHPERGSFGARLLPLRDHVSGQFRRPLVVLCCAVGCVLLIGGVNLSNLLLARAAVRRKEIAVRMALGASRWRLLRQMLTESVLLAACGAGLGIPLAYLATGAIAKSHTFDIPLLQYARVDGLALGFALVIACATGLLFGIFPALQLSQTGVHGDLKEAGRGSSHGRHRHWMREALVISEVALACVLLVGAGLLIRSFVRLLQVDLGFQPELVATCRVRTDRQFTTNVQEIAYFDEISRQVAALPGVESVGFTRTLPFGLPEIVHVRAQGETYRPEETPSVFLHGGDPGYFRTLGIPLIAGRVFDVHDTAIDFSKQPDSTFPVVVNEKMAHTVWPGKNAVGQIVFIGENGNTGGSSFKCEVVGVVGNVRHSPLDLEAVPQIYVDGAGGEMVVRTKQTLAGLAPAVRAAVRPFGADVILGDFKSMSQIVDQAVSPKRLIAFLVGLFSLLALLLAAIGIYGVIAYSVSQRTQELGIRLALGSPASAVLWLVLREGMRLAFIGCVIGLIASLGLTRVIQALLFAVSPSDPFAFAASGLLLLVVAMIACWLPGRRAARVDPMVALRHE
jgi:predicted permease